LLSKQASFRWVALLVAALVAVVAWLPAAMAQRGAGGDRIADIRIEGIQRIEPETVRSYLLLQPGDPWDPEKVDKSLKALFATGLFADVKLTRQGNTLVVSVVENPIINRIAFEGNSKLADKDLNSEIQLRPRTVYTRTRVQNDVNRILQLYRRRGRFAATVEPRLSSSPRTGSISCSRSTKAPRRACAVLISLAIASSATARCAA
jgi:outer membrane protein insertion porin family